MRNSLLIPLMLLLVFVLNGCLAGFGDNRHEANKTIRVAEEKTKQTFLETKKVELAANKVKAAEQPPTFKLINYGPSGKIITSTIEFNLAPTIEAAVGNKDDDTSTYGVDLVSTATPQGEFAENVIAIGEAGTKLANTPAAMIVSTGFAAGYMLSKAPEGTKITGETVEINDSFNRPNISAVGNENSVTSSLTSDPLVVKPEVVVSETLVVKPEVISAN